MIKLNAKQLRKGKGLRVKGKIAKNDIYIVLDNVLDTYNIGSIFRLADALAAKKIFLCGETATPPNHRIKKSSINTTEWVEWEYAESALQAITKITSEVRSFVAIASQDDNSRLDIVRESSNVQVVAIEQSKKSVPYDQFDYQLPICLIVGNETTGVSEEVLNVCDGVVELPMFGVNKSLNVMVSLGIVLYRVLSDTASG